VVKTHARHQLPLIHCRRPIAGVARDASVLNLLEVLIFKHGYRAMGISSFSFLNVAGISLRKGRGDWLVVTRGVAWSILGLCERRELRVLIG